MLHWEDNASRSDAQIKMKTQKLKMKYLLFSLFCFMFPLAVSADADPATEPLIQSTDLTYIGGFRPPQGALPGATYGFEYAGANGAAGGLAYNPAHNSLFINNHVYEQKTAEISIPALTNTTNRNSLVTATLLQNPFDLTEGHLINMIGGFMIYNDKLIGSQFIYYDAGGEATTSHFVSNLNLSQTGDFKGMYRIGSLNPAFYGGYMTSIPAEWQSAFGGPALTGQCCLSIIGRTSFGPSLHVFNPDDLGVKNPVPATALIYYDGPGPHTTLGDTQAGPYFNEAGTTVRGVVFPAGSRSILFFGRHGLGAYCYGPGTSDPNQAGQPADGGVDTWCYDPDFSSKGGHLYPYHYYVWAYDAIDLLTVKNGQKNPWDIKPYAVWSFDLPFGDGGGGFMGAAYDPATQRIYLAQTCADANCAPIIEVLQLSLAGVQPPPAGSACDVNKDNSTNVSDVQLCVNQAIGTVACSTGDINKDGACNVVDVQRVVNGALGGRCVSN
jgi:hypothetical protein